MNTEWPTTAKGITIKGITLIELMIIMTIMITLTGIAIGSYYFYVDKARQVKAQDYLKEIGEALQRFYEKNGIFPNNLQELVHAGYIIEVPLSPWGTNFYMDTGEGYIYVADKAGVSLDEMKSGAAGKAGTEVHIYKRRYKTTVFDGTFRGTQLDERYWETSTSRRFNITIDRAIYIHEKNSIAKIPYKEPLPDRCDIITSIEVPAMDGCEAGIDCGVEIIKVHDNGLFKYEIDGKKTTIVGRDEKTPIDFIPQGRDFIRIIKDGDRAEVRLKIESVHDDYVILSPDESGITDQITLTGRTANANRPVIIHSFKIVRKY